MASLRATFAAVTFAACLALCRSTGVNITSLPQSIIVTAQINGQSISDTNNQLMYLQDNLTVSWQLNASYIGQDSAYAKIVIRWCFGYPSSQGRPWRAPNTDLSLSKQCYTTIAGQPYTSFGNLTLPANHTGLLPLRPLNVSEIVLPGNTTVWQADRHVPGGYYFVRVFALNSSSSDATPASNAVAMGQTTNANATTNLVQVTPYMGTTITLDITIIVLSVASYVLLFGVFFLERWVKKNK